MLHKKLDALEDASEIAGVQLLEMLHAGGLPTDGFENEKLDGVISNKNNLIAEYHSHLRQISTSHQQIIHSYETILQKYGTAPAELGFLPSVE